MRKIVLQHNLPKAAEPIEAGRPSMSAVAPKAGMNSGGSSTPVHHGHPRVSKMRNTTMEDHQDPIPPATKRTPWNKGKLIGTKPPLWPKHVWSIRTKLQIEGRIRELALFNLAIDSKLRGCDVVGQIGRASCRERVNSQEV